MMRVTDHDVEHILAWARNYGEIASFERIVESGRKWLIRLPGDVAITADGGTGILSTPTPREFVLTSREALAFGYGCCAAGARRESRRHFAARTWGWDPPEDPPAEEQSPAVAGHLDQHSEPQGDTAHTPADTAPISRSPERGR